MAEPIEKGALVFVYGTLMQGERNHHEMRGAQCVGIGKTRDAKFLMVEVASSSKPGAHSPGVFEAPYPGVTDLEPGHITGEIYVCDDTTVKHLDRFEGVGLEYERKTVMLVDGRTAHIYLHIKNTKPFETSSPNITFDQRHKTYRWKELRCA